uniref:Shikimate dehydrogenase (NADP(+)) n=1 Tax=Ignisphaera aggregans TaxID=334771 RepID=A0A7C5XFQ9_9CREN
MSWIDVNTKLFGLIGYNISYTLSPAIHNYIFHEIGYNAVYLVFDIPEEKFNKMIDTLIELCEGLNITIPYKEKIFGFLKDFDSDAKRIGAVNTIYRGRGYNTDYTAIKSLVIEKINSLQDMICYIYGAGGAAKASAIALGDLGCRISVVNRSIERAIELVKRLNSLGYEAKVENKCGEKVDVVVNATPNPLFVHDDCLKAKLVIDLVYRPVETILIKKARDRGIDVIDGIRILVKQALDAQRIWHGNTYSEEKVIRYLYDRKLIW